MKTDLTFRGYAEPNVELQKYARHKLSELGRKVPRSIRAETTCSVKFTRQRKKEGGHKTCTMVLVLPHQTLEAQETTRHMYTALDIAVAHLVQLLHEYKLQYHRRRLPRPRLIRPQDSQ
jgi:ribosome-associated translation inhibitor RaiA